MPSLVLAPHEAIFIKLRRQAERFQQAGLPAKMVDLAEMAELEPALNPTQAVGALLAEQGHLDGAALTEAYANAARRLGAEVREYAPVRGFELKDDRVISVQTDQENVSAGQVAKDVP